MEIIKHKNDLINYKYEGLILPGTPMEQKFNLKNEKPLIEESWIDKKAKELASIMNVSEGCARGHILEAMREHSKKRKRKMERKII